MAKIRIIKDYPRLDEKLESFQDVELYLSRLLKAMNEFRPRLFQGDIHVSAVAPTANDGEDGDLWITC
jgi:hypothetical protein